MARNSNTSIEKADSIRSARVEEMRQRLFAPKEYEEPDFSSVSFKPDLELRDAPGVSKTPTKSYPNHPYNSRGVSSNFGEEVAKGKNSPERQKVIDTAKKFYNEFTDLKDEARTKVEVAEKKAQMNLGINPHGSLFDPNFMMPENKLTRNKLYNVSIPGKTKKEPTVMHPQDFTVKIEKRSKETDKQREAREATKRIAKYTENVEVKDPTPDRLYAAKEKEILGLPTGEFEGSQHAQDFSEARARKFGYGRAEKAAGRFEETWRQMFGDTGGGVKEVAKSVTVPILAGGSQAAQPFQKMLAGEPVDAGDFLDIPIGMGEAGLGVVLAKANAVAPIVEGLMPDAPDLAKEFIPFLTFKNPIAMFAAAKGSEPASEVMMGMIEGMFELKPEDQARIMQMVHLGAFILVEKGIKYAGKGGKLAIDNRPKLKKAVDKVVEDVKAMRKDMLGEGSGVDGLTFGLDPSQIKGYKGKNGLSFGEFVKKSMKELPADLKKEFQADKELLKRVKEQGVKKVASDYIKDTFGKDESPKPIESVKKKVEPKDKAQRKAKALALAKEREGTVAEIKTQLDSDNGLGVTNKNNGLTYTLSKDSRNKNQWKIASFDKDGAVNDRVYKNLNEAITDFIISSEVKLKDLKEPTDVTKPEKPFEEMTKEEFTSPYPKAEEGYEILYHRTHPDNVGSIKQNGLQTSKATGKEAPEGLTWFSTDPKEYGESGSLVAIKVPKGDKSIRKENSTYRTSTRDIKPEEIVRIYDQIDLPKSASSYGKTKVREDVLRDMGTAHDMFVKDAKPSKSPEAQHLEEIESKLNNFAKEEPQLGKEELKQFRDDPVGYMKSQRDAMAEMLLDFKGNKDLVAEIGKDIERLSETIRNVEKVLKEPDVKATSHVENAKKNLERKGGGVANLGLDPTVLKDLAIIGADIIKKGADNLKDFVTELKKTNYAPKKDVRKVYEASVETFEKDKIIRAYHYSDKNAESFKVDPKKFGENPYTPSANSAINRSFFYVDPANTEPIVRSGRNLYETDMEKARIYNLREDKQGYLDGVVNVDEAFKKIKKKYDGIYYEEGNIPPTVSLFKKHSVNKTPNYTVGITNATTEVKKRAILLEKAANAEQIKDFDKANTYYEAILDVAERGIERIFKNDPDIKFEAKRSIGIFGLPEPTIILDLSLPSARFDYAMAKLAKLGIRWKQDNVHVYQKVGEPNAKHGEVLADGSVYEPYVQIKFENTLTEGQKREVANKLGEFDIFGGTVTADGKGLMMYNLSRGDFKEKPEVFREKIQKLERGIESLGEGIGNVTAETGSVRLWNIGNDKYGATRGYEDITSKVYTPPQFELDVKGAKRRLNKVMRQNGGQLNLGVDPSALKDLVLVATDLIKNGAHNVGKLKERLTSEMGKGVGKYADLLWNKVSQRDKEDFRENARAALNRKEPERPEGDIDLQPDLFTIKQKISRAFFYKYARSEQIVKAGKKKKESVGEVLDESMDFATKGDLYIKRAANKIEEIKDKLLDGENSMIEQMARDNVVLDDFSLFLWARHAPERNKYIKDKYDKDMGSGMSDKEAKDIMDKFDAEYTKKLEKYADMAQEVLTKPTLKRLLDEGLISKEDFDTYTNRFKHYVPLKGVEEGVDIIMGTSGFSTSGSGVMQAFGREGSIPNDPFLQARLDATNSIIRSERNKVGVSFYDFAKEFPDSKLWTVESRKYVPKYDSKGEVVGMDKLDLKPNQFSVLVKEGDAVKNKIITIKDPDLLTVMKWIGGEKTNKFMGKLNKVNNYLRGVITMYSPEFIITNFERDIQTALINIGGEESLKMAGKVAKDTVPALRGIHRVERGKPAGEWGKWYERYKKAGGKMSWVDSRPIEELSREFSKKFKDFNKEKGFTRRKLQAGIEFIEDWNTAVENSARLSAFKNLIESGVSEQKAAHAAANLTVNFDRKGEWAEFMNTWYLFWNAGAQGGARITKALGKKKTRKIAYGMMGLSFALDNANRQIAPDEYDKIDDYIKETNWIFMLPNGSHLKIRLPYGYNVFNVAGQAMSEVASGKKDVLDGSTKILRSAVDAFNPWGSAGSLAQFISPTLGDPIIQIAENKNFFSAPLKPDEPSFTPPPKAGSRYFNSVNPVARGFTDFVNNLTGGNEFESGKVDVSPEDVEHLIEFLGGGAGKFVWNSLNTGVSLISKDEAPDVTKIPFVRQAYGETSEYADLRNIYDMFKESHRTQFSEKEKADFGNYLDSAVKDGKITAKQRKTFRSQFFDGQRLLEDNTQGEVLRKKEIVTQTRKKWKNTTDENTKARLKRELDEAVQDLKDFMETDEYKNFEKARRGNKDRAKPKRRISY